MKEPSTNVLVHYGVKGMKWGERNEYRKNQAILNPLTEKKDGNKSTTSKEELERRKAEFVKRIKEQIAKGSSNKEKKSSGGGRGGSGGKKSSSGSSKKSSSADKEAEKLKKEQEEKEKEQKKDKKEEINKNLKSIQDMLSSYLSEQKESGNAVDEELVTSLQQKIEALEKEFEKLKK